VGKGRIQGKGEEAECNGNIMYSHMKMERSDLLKLLQEQG
jgi:hypothetical protein